MAVCRVAVLRSGRVSDNMAVILKKGLAPAKYKYEMTLSALAKYERELCPATGTVRRDALPGSIANAASGVAGAQGLHGL